MNSRNCLATQLSKFLRLNGEEVLNGNCKLSLTTHALSSLNNIFSDVLLSERCEGEVFHENKHTIALFEDVQFLIAFVSKTPYLKVFHCGQTLRGGVDVSKFVSLKVLELHKVPAHLVVGLENLSSQLKALICHRSLCFLKEIFIHSNPESELKDVWIELSELNISFNYMDGFDHSLGLLPNLAYIDASHNNLKHLDEIQMLERLAYLNLNYNLLENIPMLSILSCYSLKVLFLRNNVLETLEGIEVLLNLEQLDVSYNCLSEYSTLIFLRKLMALKTLHLEGNPLFFHKKHRLLTAHYLHPAVIANHILLNGEVLAPIDVSSSGQRSFCAAPPINFHQTSINVMVEDASNGCVNPELNYALMHTAPEDKEITCDMKNESSHERDDKSEMEISVHKLLKGKSYKKNIREVLIQDPEENTNVEDAALLSDVAAKKNEQLIPVHLQTKLLLETRRKEYKEEWLIPSDSFQTLVTNTSAFKVPPNTPSSNFVLPDPVEKISTTPSLEFAVQHLNSVSKQLVACEKNEFVENTVDENSGSHVNKQEEFNNFDDIIVLPLQTCDQEHSENSSSINCYSDTVYQSNIRNSSDESDDNSDSFEDSDGRIFVVKRVDGNENIDLFVKVGERFITEMDSISARIIDCLDLRSLISVEVFEKIIQQEQVEYVLTLVFDSAKFSRQNRKYIVCNKEVCDEMFKVFKPFADAKTLYDLTLGAFQCLKCSSEFSKQAVHRKAMRTKNPSTAAEHDLKKSGVTTSFWKEAYICPNCGSDVIVEIDVLPIPYLQSSAKNAAFSAIKHFSPNFDSQKDLDYTKNENMEKDGPGDENLHSVSNLVIDQGVPESDAISESSAIESTSCSWPNMHRNTSGSTLISNQSSITVISETESNNNVILENMQTSPLTSPSNQPQHLDLHCPISPTLQGSGSPCSSTTTPSPCLKNVQLSHESEHNQNTPGVLINMHAGEILATCDTSELPSLKLHHEDIKKEPLVMTYRNQFRIHESLNLINLLAEREQFSFETFSMIDHRLKLHLEINIFDDDEHLESCLEAFIVAFPTCEEMNGLFAVSNKKIRIIMFRDGSSTEFENNTKQLCVMPLCQLKEINVLLGSQGFVITFNSDNRAFLLLIRDADMCNCFLSHLTEIFQVKLPNFELRVLSLANESLIQVEKEIIHHYYADNANSGLQHEILLYMFAFCEIPGQKEKTLMCIIVTSEDIFLSAVKFKKQSKTAHMSSLYTYVPFQKQRILDLTELHVSENLLNAEVIFQDEDGNTSCVWTISTRTKSSLLSFLSALKNPWEALFEIEIPIYFLSE